MRLALSRSGGSDPIVAGQMPEQFAAILQTEPDGHGIDIDASEVVACPLARCPNGTAMTARTRLANAAAASHRTRTERITNTTLAAVAYTRNRRICA